MKLWPGWEKECKSANPERWGADVYIVYKPGNKQASYFKYKVNCGGCHEPFLAQAKMVNRQYIYGDFCSIECRAAGMEYTDEQIAHWSWLGKNRSPETEQRVLEANRKPRSAETRIKMGDAWRGRKHTDDTKAKMREASLGIPKTPEAAIKSAQARRFPDRVGVAVNKVINRCRQNAKTHGRVFELTKDEIRALVTQACLYCDIAPNNEAILHSAHNLYAHNDENILLHGLDRIDSSKGYTIDNVVTSCTDCNLAKRSRSTADFVSWAVQVENFKGTKIEDLVYYGDIVEKQQWGLTTVYGKYLRHAWPVGKHTEKFIPLTIDKNCFAHLIRTQCYYCGAGLTNYYRCKQGRKRDRGAPEKTLNYNGLDRVDSGGIYELSNVVPCCCHCNRAKQQMSIDYFYTWIHRLVAHIQATPALLSLVSASV
jgi:hypothetical protein